MKVKIISVEHSIKGAEGVLEAYGWLETEFNCFVEDNEIYIEIEDSLTKLNKLLKRMDKRNKKIIWGTFYDVFSGFPTITLYDDYME